MDLNAASIRREHAKLSNWVLAHYKINFRLSVVLKLPFSVPFSGDSHHIQGTGEVHSGSAQTALRLVIKPVSIGWVKCHSKRKPYEILYLREHQTISPVLVQAQEGLHLPFSQLKVKHLKGKEPSERALLRCRRRREDNTTLLEHSTPCSEGQSPSVCPWAPTTVIR